MKRDYHCEEGQPFYISIKTTDEANEICGDEGFVYPPLSCSECQGWGCGACTEAISELGDKTLKLKIEN
jgi:hypothetical protein